MNNNTLATTTTTTTNGFDISNSNSSDPCNTKQHIETSHKCLLESNCSGNLSTTANDIETNNSNDIMIESLLETINHIVSKDKTFMTSTKGSDFMDYEEKYFDRLNQDVNSLKADIKISENSLSGKIDSSIESLKNELRHVDNQRSAENSAIRAEQSAINKHMQTTMYAILAIVIAIILGIASMVFTVDTGMGDQRKQFNDLQLKQQEQINQQKQLQEQLQQIKQQNK
jgi:hypothetical protein